MNRRFSTLALAALTASALFAQGHGTPGTPPTAAEIVANRVAHLTSLLTLTAAQQAQATTIFTTAETANASIRTSMQTARTALQTAVTNNDANGITADATQIGNLTTQQVHAQATADAAFYAILTADQQAKYKTLGHGGFGGPGGPGGFGPRGAGRGFGPPPQNQ